MCQLADIATITPPSVPGVFLGGGLALPESVFHVALDHDCEDALVALPGRGIGNRRAGFLGRFYCLLDVLDREVRPHDRLLMPRQRLSDADQSSVRSGRDTGL